MNPTSILCDPTTGAELSFENNQLVGSLRAYSMLGNLVNFLDREHHEHAATDAAASFRWNNSTRLEGDSGFQQHQLSDFLLRYGLVDENEFRSFLKPCKTILEIGAGEGRLVDWYLRFSEATVYALEISESVHYLSAKYADQPRVVVLKADAAHPPIQAGTIDLVSADQCIHHTDQPGEIFNALAPLLSPQGKFLLSVYAEKSIVREQVDEIVRSAIAVLPPTRVAEIASKFTEIGRLLHEMDVNVQVPASAHLFGHLAGEQMSLQRFVYYAFFKCFYNPAFTKAKSDEFNHDWYCYPICHKTSVDAVVAWFVRNQLQIDYLDSNPSNVNVRGGRKA